MKLNFNKKFAVTFIALFLSIASITAAQPAANALDIHGLDQFSLIGVRSRAMGGTTIANANDASALFSNPAALSKLKSIEIRAGGFFANTARKQTQEWVPQRSAPGLGLLFEGLTGTIKTPDSAGVPGVTEKDPWKTVQRQYDNIKPNWNNSTSAIEPFSFAAAVPFEIEGFSIVAGIGASKTIDLNNYYQNNNSMSPYLGQLRPYTNFYDRSKPTDTAHVKWYQYIRERKGSMYGVTPGIAVTILTGLTIGGSATIHSGSSDDNESRLDRGHLNIAVENGAPQNFMVDTVYYKQSKVGTSTYSGNSMNVGLYFQQERYSIGITVAPEMTITRTWKRDVSSIDTTRKTFPVRVDSLTTRSYHESGKDNLTFPLSYSFGIVLTPTDKWTIAFDYEMRYLSDVNLTTTLNSAPTHPWSNNRGSMHIGAEYRPDKMLALRGGYRDDVQPFSPDGAAIIGEPARGGIYSLGAGIFLEDILIDFAYEYSLLKYEDMYQSNVNYNSREQHRLMMEIAYRF